MVNLQIAIDGPAGSGKSTVAKEIAKRLNITYLDTGAMYRAVTLLALRKKADILSAKALKSIVDTIKLDITPTQLFVNGEEVSEAIRTPEVTKNVSSVSMDQYVREQMVALQQKIAHGKSVIMDGRDIGTTVLPNAAYKFFLIADPVERAKRRKIEFDAKGFETTIETLTMEIIERDKLDSQRQFSPLKRAIDAIEIDTTFMTIEDVVQTIITTIEK